MTGPKFTTVNCEKLEGMFFSTLLSSFFSTLLSKYAVDRGHACFIEKRFLCYVKFSLLSVYLLVLSASCKSVSHSWLLLSEYAVDRGHAFFIEKKISMLCEISPVCKLQVCQPFLAICKSESHWQVCSLQCHFILYFHHLKFNV